jgi:hypothetical protein
MLSSFQTSPLDLHGTHPHGRHHTPRQRQRKKGQRLSGNPSPLGSPRHSRTHREQNSDAGRDCAALARCTLRAIRFAPARRRFRKLQGKSVTTIEGLGANGLHILQEAWIAEEVPQCGYCQTGQIMSAAALLAKTPHPTDEQITAAMNGNLCRCGTYERIRKAIHRAAGRAAGSAARKVARDEPAFPS